MEKDNINKAEIIEKVSPVIEKAVEECGLVLLEVDFVNEFNKWHLQVFIYNPIKTVTHEDCQKITDIIADPIDSIIPFPFYLEVSSPGIERKLKSSKEYEIYKGYRVKIKLKQPILENLKVFIAEILDFTQENGLKIGIEDSKEIIEIDENNILQIKLEPKYKY